MMSFIQNIKGLTADSRKVKKDYLFAAFSGTKKDGNAYINQAIENGATHILIQTGMPKPDNVVTIESDNPRCDFALMCAQFYNAQPDTIIAVTGTNGKTSTVDFIRQILEMNGRKSASLGTLGLVSNHVQGENFMTTPDPETLHALLSKLKKSDVTHLAMEASSHGIDQYRIEGVKIKVAAFTNLTQDHLDYHETMASYFQAKEKLFSDYMGDKGISVVNIDDVYGQKIKNIGISFGKSDSADFQIIEQIPQSNGQDLKLKYQNNIYDIHLNLIGLFQAYNVVCAIVCCIAIGLDIKDIIQYSEHLKGVSGRVELADLRNGKAAYIDYAHTPDALEKVLTALRPHVLGRLICVFGAGGDRDKTKRPLMGQAVEKYADIAIITDDNPRTENPEIIRQEIQIGCSNAINIGDRRRAIEYAVSIMEPGDVLLVAGKGHEKGQMIGVVNHPFDDLMETKQAMEKLL